MSTLHIVGEILHDVDATPDEEYPLRILRAHLYNCESTTLTDNTSGAPPTNIVCIEMNKANVERAVILRRAIAALMHTRTAIRPWPVNQPRKYNGRSEPCDMWTGPCSCGATHVEGV